MTRHYSGGVKPLLDISAWAQSKLDYALPSWSPDLGEDPPEVKNLIESREDEKFAGGKSKNDSLMPKFWTNCSIILFTS